MGAPDDRLLAGGPLESLRSFVAAEDVDGLRAALGLTPDAQGLALAAEFLDTLRPENADRRAAGQARLDAEHAEREREDARRRDERARGRERSEQHAREVMRYYAGLLRLLGVRAVRAAFDGRADSDGWLGLPECDPPPAAEPPDGLLEDLWSCMAYLLPDGWNADDAESRGTITLDAVTGATTVESSRHPPRQHDESAWPAEEETTRVAPTEPDWPPPGDGIPF